MTGGEGRPPVAGPGFGHDAGGAGGRGARVNCPAHGPTVVAVPWARHHAGHCQVERSGRCRQSHQPHASHMTWGSRERIASNPGLIAQLDNAREALRRGRGRGVRLVLHAFGCRSRSQAHDPPRTWIDRPRSTRTARDGRDRRVRHQRWTGQPARAVVLATLCSAAKSILYQRITVVRAGWAGRYLDRGGSVTNKRGTVNLRSCGRSANHISLIRHTRPGESRRRTGENRPRIAQVDSALERNGE